jgi:hypothetical protein
MMLLCEGVDLLARSQVYELLPIFHGQRLIYRLSGKILQVALLFVKPLLEDGDVGHVLIMHLL